jgi:hypothetical protein
LAIWRAETPAASSFRICSCIVIAIVICFPVLPFHEPLHNRSSTAREPTKGHTTAAPTGRILTAEMAGNQPRSWQENPAETDYL